MTCLLFVPPSLIVALCIKIAIFRRQQVHETHRDWPDLLQSIRYGVTESRSHNLLNISLIWSTSGCSKVSSSTSGGPSFVMNHVISIFRFNMRKRKLQSVIVQFFVFSSVWWHIFVPKLLLDDFHISACTFSEKTLWLSLMSLTAKLNRWLWHSKKVPRTYAEWCFYACSPLSDQNTFRSNSLHISKIFCT